jgi:hypothetical protein
MNAIKIPEGYRQNANGDLVKLENIKEIDLLRDELVNDIAARALAHSGVLAEFKATVFTEVQGFIQASAAKYKAKLGGAKGNVTLFSFDGRYKLQIANQDNVCFDERLQAAKALLDKCIKKWSEGASDNLLALVNDAFQVDKTGNVSIRRVMGLRNLDIQDRDWRKAMDAISDSVQIVGSKSYIRVYEREDTGEYRPISLDMASV